MKYFQDSRPGSLRIVDSTLKELKISNIKSLSLVMNDLGPEYKRYGYGGKYGYSYGIEKSKK